MNLVDGFGVSLTQIVTMEVGSNASEKFPTEKNFCSWMGLAPKHEISGGKVLTLAPHCVRCSAGENKTLKTKNRAGQAFTRSVAAQSVKQSDSVFGVMYKRFRARQGPSQATISTAHAIARVVYRMLKY
jgi:transposase